MKRAGLLTLLVGLLFSCNPNIDFKRIVPPEVNNFATGFIEDIKKGDIEKCLSQVTSEMNNQAGRDYLTNAFDNFQSLKIDSSRIINARKTSLIGENGYTNYFIDYEYFVSDKFLYFNFGIHEENHKLTITAFDGRFYDTSLTTIHSFTFKDKGFAHYIFVLFAVLVPLFILVTLIFAIRTRMNKKWLWIVGIIFGFVKFSLSWTTGQVAFQTLSFQIFGAGLTKSGLVAPWTISFSLPLIGICFWIKKYIDKKDEEMFAKFAEEVRDRKTREAGKTTSAQQGA